MLCFKVCPHLDIGYHNFPLGEIGVFTNAENVQLRAKTKSVSELKSLQAISSNTFQSWLTSSGISYFR